LSGSVVIYATTHSPIWRRTMLDESEYIVVEEAKNGQSTCKILVEGKWRYVYSKYHPNESLQIPQISPNEDCVLLGLGLGHELSEIRKITSGKITVIDKTPFFLNHLSKWKSFQVFLNDPLIEFLIGDKYKGKILKNQNTHFIQTNITKFDLAYYSLVIKFHKNKQQKRKKEKIVFLEHQTIAHDCIDALKELNYSVTTLEITRKENLTLSIAQENPDFVFSINPDSTVLSACKTLGIPYIFWTVDTPHYQLYLKEMIDDNVFAFVYDNDIKNELISKGYKNIFHMPVAVNSRRFDQIEILPSDINRYQTQVSFVGTTGSDNEFNLFQFERHLNTFLLQRIEEIFDEQRKSGNEQIIQKLVDTELVLELEKQLGPLREEELLDKRRKLFFLLGRKYNEIERIKLVQHLSDKYKTKIYGDNAWGNLKGKHLQFMGFAEHHVEMSKVFRLSKININMTRIFVESGLPQRVFDVLGSQGFLISNHKKDLENLFSIGKDLVVYRDLKDLSELIDYFLHHEEKRLEIAQNGYEKVKNEHTYEIRLKKMMSIVKEKLSSKA
ncbi:MAG: spore maturation protein CgeB, partial [Chlamydiales bacterium]